MGRYPLNLPEQLKQEAQEAARQQGVSLNQLILWAVAEKVTELRGGVNDPRFPGITYRRSASGAPTAYLAGTGIRVASVYVAHRDWGLSAAEVGAQYGVAEERVEEALAFAEAHRAQIEADPALAPDCD
jgi:uncharacterized protein (DUF433 family)